MKQKFILLLSIIILSATTFAQTDKEDINKMFNTYKQALDSLQLEKSMDYIYPKLYEIAPKEQLIAIFKKTFSDPNVQIRFSQIRLKSISETKVHNKVKYALVSYDYAMIFTFSKAYSIEQIYTLYQKKYGVENVSKDDKNRSISIKMDKLFYAINDPKYGNSWCFLEKNKAQKQMLETLIPKEIINKL